MLKPAYVYHRLKWKKAQEHWKPVCQLGQRRHGANFFRDCPKACAEHIARNCGGHVQMCKNQIRRGSRGGRADYPPIEYLMSPHCAQVPSEAVPASSWRVASQPPLFQVSPFFKYFPSPQTDSRLPVKFQVKFRPSGQNEDPSVRKRHHKMTNSWAKMISLHKVPHPNRHTDSTYLYSHLHLAYWLYAIVPWTKHSYCYSFTKFIIQIIIIRQ